MRRRANSPSLAIILIVLAMLCLAAFAGVERMIAARRAALGGSFVDVEKIQAQMDRGNLSDREAQFYRTLEVELGY